MNSTIRAWILDSVVAGSLGLALITVFAMDRGKPAPPPGPAVEVKTVDETPPAPPLRLAVTPPEYDDMGRLLKQLGTGYHHQEIELDDLRDPKRLAGFDVVFLTCGGAPESWTTGKEFGAGSRPGTVRVEMRQDVQDELKQSLRDFVKKGGTLYVSDLRLLILRNAFPEIFPVERFTRGAKQSIVARVVDSGLRDAVGRELPLNFDQPDWFPAILRGPKSITYLEGSYRGEDGELATAPLLVKVPFGEGTIIFTSFHNEKANGEKEIQLLRYLVLNAVTAKEVEKVSKTLVSSGFSPQKQNLLSATLGDPSVTQTYTQKEAGPLRFVLGFANHGARLRLSVKGPNSPAKVQTGTSTFTIDLTDAPAGEWTYTVTAEKVPYPNFPFTLTIGGK